MRPRGEPEAHRWLACAASCLAVLACRASEPAPRPGPSASATASAPEGPERAASVTPPEASALPSATATSAEPRRVVLLAGGDAFFGRGHGQLLLDDPRRDPFATLRPLWERAELRHVNLESVIVDRGRDTGHPENRRIFSAPPVTARVLAERGVDLVSLANNHAWDFGRPALFETFTHLEAAGVRWVGAGRSADEAYAPVVLERNGLRVAFVAATLIWNQGPLEAHEGRAYVAGADHERLVGVVEKLANDRSVARVVVSLHAGEEYRDDPTPSTRALVARLVGAGADLVLGHHTHAVQGVSFEGAAPVVWSLGNLTMGMHPEHPWSELGMLARVTLEPRPAPLGLEVCPFRLRRFDPVLLAGDPGRATYERRFVDGLRRLSRLVGDATIHTPGPDGCARVTPGASGLRAPLPARPAASAGSARAAP